MLLAIEIEIATNLNLENTIDDFNKSTEQKTVV